MSNVLLLFRGLGGLKHMHVDHTASHHLELNLPQADPSVRTFVSLRAVVFSRHWFSLPTLNGPLLHKWRILTRVQNTTNQLISSCFSYLKSHIFSYLILSKFDDMINILLKSYEDREMLTNTQNSSFHAFLDLWTLWILL